VILLRIGVGFAAWAAALLALALALFIPFGREMGANIGGGIGLLLFFALMGMAVAAPTVRVTFGRGLKVIGGCFWAAIAVAAIMRYPQPLASADPTQLQFVTIPTLLIGGLFGGALFVLGHFLTRRPEPGAPGLLARNLTPFLERYIGGPFSARRVDAHRRLQLGAGQGVGRFDESLPHLRGFNAFYRDNIAAWLEKQEDRRKEALRFRTKVLVIGLPIMAAVTLGLDGLVPFGEGFWGGVLGWIDLLAWLLVLAVAFGKGFSLRDDIKGFMIGHLCNFFRLSHEAEEKPADLSPYEKLDLIPSHTEAKIREAFRGRREQVDMYMAEAVAYVYRGAGARRRRAAVFNGALLQFTYRKRFQGRTIAMSDRGLVGNLLKGSWRSEQRIRLEDRAFEDRFEVYGTDEVESRYLLTPAFMERMVALSDLIGSSKRLRFAFAEGRFLLVVPGWDLFETASLAHAMTDPVHVQTFLNEIGLVLDIADIMKLNLDSRI